MVKRILILGAGVAGLHAAQFLAREKSEELHITLVDQSDVHVLRADLYEVATAFNEEITEECMVNLKSTVATPILSLLDPEKVHFVQDEVLKLDPKKKKVYLKGHAALSYDVLLVAMGSVTNFFNIPGIEKHALAFKSVSDALAINCHLDQLFLRLWKRKEIRPVHLSIGGGGATGCELAAELSLALQKLCQKYAYPRSKVHVDLIQSGQDLGGMDSLGTEKIAERLRALGVSLYRPCRIQKMLRREVLLLDAKKKLKHLPSDLLIWTAGVKVHPVLAESLGTVGKGGAIEVASTLQSLRFPEVFAAGDNAFLESPAHSGKRVPMLARPAWKEGVLMAGNAVNYLSGGKLKHYKPVRREWLILPLGGKYALFQMGSFLLSGFWAWFLRRLIILRYHFSTMSFSRAFRKWKKGGRLFEQNDSLKL